VACDGAEADVSALVAGQRERNLGRSCHSRMYGAEGQSLPESGAGAWVGLSGCRDPILHAQPLRSMQLGGFEPPTSWVRLGWLSLGFRLDPA
jgi:hypothetical protein